jgi:hypothetical protein
MDQSLSNFAFALLTADRSMTTDRAAELLVNNLTAVNEVLSVRSPRVIVSEGMSIQLAWLRSGYPCSYGGQIYELDQRIIIDEIAHLENHNSPTSTKPHEPMAGMLRGFWHKHFLEAHVLSRDLSREVQRNSDTLWNRDLLSAGQSDPTLRDEVDVGRLAGLIGQTMVHSAFQNRLGSLSAERSPARLERGSSLQGTKGGTSI